MSGQSPPPSRRRGRAAALVLLVGAALSLSGCSWPVHFTGGPVRTAAVEWKAAYTPSPRVADLAERALLTPEGRDIFFETRPKLVRFEHVSKVCHVEAIGCYSGNLPGRIRIYAPTDPRLVDMMTSIAAHELLHAAYARLSEHERTLIDRLIEVEFDRLPRDEHYRHIDHWADREPVNRGTELFAYLGTEVWIEGGFAPELEAIYHRFITDRSALVQIYSRHEGMLDDLDRQLQDRWAQVQAQELHAADARFDSERQRTDYDALLREYEEDSAAYRTGSPQDRGASVRYGTPDGGLTDWMTWPEALDYQLERLERLRVAIETQDAAASALEEQAAQSRADAEAFAAEIEALNAQAFPRLED